MKTRNKNTKISKRMRPLYVAAFFHGFVLWYPIEKLFMVDIGFNQAGIGVMIAFYSVVMLIAETPSGILADRWSRKGVLMLASLFLTLSSLIGGLSDAPIIYLASAAMWGVFFAMYSGTYESIVYDTVLEEGLDSSQYEKYYGRINITVSIALVLGSLLGGLVSTTFGLNMAYFLTIPFSILSLLALLKFKEPILHKSEVYVPIMKHIRTTFSSVLKNAKVRPVVLTLIFGSVLTYMTLEFSSVWFIALAMSATLYGPVHALQLSTIGFGGFLAGRFELSSYRSLVAVLSLILLGGLGLIFSRNITLTITSLLLLSLFSIALRIVFGRLLHDSLESSVRAGAASTVSTLGRIIIIPLSLVMGLVSEAKSIFTASWLLFAVCLIVAYYAIKTFSGQSKLPSVVLNGSHKTDLYQK
jgi:MFS family permease